MKARLWSIGTLLLAGLCQSLSGRHRVDGLGRRSLDGLDAEFVDHVYRGETARSPAEVERSGGFYARGLQRQQAGIRVSAAEAQKGSSLFYHAAGETAPFTRYISTSADPGVALTFAVDDDKPAQKGYIYKIHADGRMVDVNRSLGRYSPYAAQVEHAAIGFIPYEQIEGWWEVSYQDNFSDQKAVKDSRESLRRGRLGGFRKNLKFDKGVFHKLRSAGAAPQLAGFPRVSAAWQDDTWRRFRTQAVESNLDDFIGAVCAAKPKSSTGCMAQLGYRSGRGFATPKYAKMPPHHYALNEVEEKPAGGGGTSSSAKSSHGTKGAAAVDGQPARKTAPGVLTKAVVTKYAFALLLPYARQLLEAIKQWDNPVGETVRWLDDAMASLQETIGGPQRPDIYGNDLKAKLICMLKGGRADTLVAGQTNGICTPIAEQFNEALQQDFQAGRLDELIETCKGIQTYSGGHPLAWNWMKMYCAAFHRTDEYAERVWELALGGLLESCSELDANPPGGETLRARLEGRCAAFRTEVDRVQRVKDRLVAAERCKCDFYNLQPLTDYCGKICRTWRLIHWRWAAPGAAKADYSACGGGQKACFGQCVSQHDSCHDGAFGVCPAAKPSVWQSAQRGLCCDGGADGTRGADGCTPQVPPCNPAAGKECFGKCVSKDDICHGDAFGVCPAAKPSVWQGGLCCDGGAEGTQGADNCSPQLPPCNPRSGKECFGRCISNDDVCHGDAFGACPAAKPSVWQGGVCCNGGADGTQGGENCTPQVPPCNPRSGRECFGKCIANEDVCHGDAFGVCPWTRPSIWQGGVCCNGGADGTQGGENCTPQVPPCNPRSGRECFGRCISKEDFCNPQAFGVCPSTRPSVWQGGMCCNGGADGTQGGDNCIPQMPPCNPTSGQECGGKCISKESTC